VKEYLTVKEVAKYLKKHPASVRRLIRARKLKAQKLAGKYGVYIVTRSDLLEFMMSKVMSEANDLKRSK
jgi:excisionase family DNA binding protein